MIAFYRNRFVPRVVRLMALLVLFMGAATPTAAQGDLIQDRAAAAALQTALEATLQATSFQYTFDLALTFESDTNLALVLQGEGGIDTSSTAPAFRLAVDGTLDVDGDEMPAIGEVRFLDDIIYVQFLDAASGQQSEWAGVQSADLIQALSTGAAQQGSTVDTQALLGGDLGAISPEFAPLLVLFSNLDPDDYTGIEQLEAANGHPLYRTTLSLPSLVTSSGGEAIIRYFLEIGGADATSLAQASLVAQFIGTALEDSSIILDQTVDPASGLIERALLTVQGQIDPRRLGQTGSLVSLDLVFDVGLSGLNQTTGIEAPPNVPISDANTFINRNAPAQGLLSGVTGGSTTAGANISAAQLQPSATPIPPSQDTGAPAPPAPTASAPTSGGKINPGQPVTVMLSGTGPVDLTYRPIDGQALDVSARSLETDGVIDTTLEILDSAGQQLAYNDDQDMSDDTLARTDSHITGYVVEGTGELTIRVSTFVSGQSGQVEVTLSSGASAPATPEGVGDGGSLVIQGEVPVNSEYSYTFSAQAGQTVTLTVRALDSNFDPKATLRDTNGAALAQNDDHGADDPALDRFDSRIADFSVPETGDYTLVITGFSGSGGAFELTIEGDIGTADNVPLPTPDPTDQDAFVQLTERLNGAQDFTYPFDGTAGDLVTITARALSDDADLLLVLRDPDDAYLADNDTHGSNDSALGINDARLYNMLLPVTGTYSISVSDYAASDAQIELTLERVASGLPLDAPDERVIVDAIPSGGRIEETVEVSAGQLLTLIVRGLSGDLDPRVSLISSDGVLLLENDDAGAQGGTLGFYDSRINNYLIEESGTYTIEISGYAQTAGDFALTIGVRR